MQKKFLCPSAPAREKAILLGVVQADGSVAFIKDRIEINQEFLDIAARKRAPETQFRFSSGCIGSACKQWDRGECSLPDRLTDIIPLSESPAAPLPDCSIREQCRWFDERGATACRVCPLIVRHSDLQ